MQRKADKIWMCRGRAVRLRGPEVMAIVNVTPDSFFAGSRAASAEDAAARGAAAFEAGALIVDIGGESTRPGAAAVSIEEEIARVTPAIQALRRACPEGLISVDTRRTAVARAALEAGADIVNDVQGLNPDAGMAALLAETGAGYVLMHGRGWTPRGEVADRADAVAEIESELAAAVARLAEAGVDVRQVALDPGLGFEKSHADSWRLVGATARFAAGERPWLVAASRKRFLGGTAAASVGVALWSAAQGADLVRVHDVAETAGALRAFARAEEAAHV